jgi:predicted metal-binding protein
LPVDLRFFGPVRESLENILESKSEDRIFRAVILAQERVLLLMAKRRGNPNWGKPEPIGPVTPTITEFEQVVREYKLSPDQYLRSTRLREWARRNKNSKYIPEPLLEAWGFEIESTL